jgi:hypothetical protein
MLPVSRKKCESVPPVVIAGVMPQLGSSSRSTLVMALYSGVWVVDSLPSCIWIMSKLNLSKPTSWSRPLIVVRVSSTLWPGSTRQSKTTSDSEGMMFSLHPPPIMVGVRVVFVRGRISSASALSFLANSSSISSLLSGLFRRFVKSSFTSGLIRATSEVLFECGYIYC